MVLLLKSVSLFSILLMIKPPRIPTIAAADCDIDVKNQFQSCMDAPPYSTILCMAAVFFQTDLSGQHRLLVPGKCDGSFSQNVIVEHQGSRLLRKTETD